MRNSLGTSFWWLFALLFGLSLIIHSRRQSPKPWQTLGCVLLLSLDLLLAGSSVNVYAPKDFFRDEPAVAQIVRQHIGKGRLYRDDNPENIQLFAPSNDVVWGYRWSLETLDGYLGAFWKIPVIFHDDYVGLGNKHLMTLKGAVKSLPWPQKLPLLSVAGVTAILSADPRLASLPGIEKVAEIENRSSAPFFLYRNTRAAAPVEFISNVRHATSDDMALHVMQQADYDPRRDVILQAKENPPDVLQQETCRPAKIETARSNPHRQEFSISADCDGILLFSTPFYPGWDLQVDETPAPRLRANFAFSAIPLARGEHFITCRYIPVSLLSGLLCTFASLMALVVFFTQHRFF